MANTVIEALEGLRVAAADGRLAAVCRQFCVEIVVLFGSATSSLQARDVDVAVGFSHGADREVLGLLRELSTLMAGDHLDLLDLDRAGPVARVEALTKGQVLYEREPGVFGRREITALGEYLDTAYLRETLLRDLAR